MFKYSSSSIMTERTGHATLPVSGITLQSVCSLLVNRNCMCGYRYRANCANPSRYSVAWVQGKTRPVTVAKINQILLDWDGSKFQAA